jgi:hypothetical protein
VTVLVQLALAALISGTSPAYDTVFLMSGGRLRGEVIEADPKVSVTIQLPGGERRRLPAAEVLRIDYQDASAPGVGEVGGEGGGVPSVTRLPAGGRGPPTAP